MAYIRTNIYLTKRQKQILPVMAKAKDTKAAELVRRALDEYFDRNPLPQQKGVWS